jgi:hypothetical protein
MPIDKQYHFIAGFLIYLIAQFFVPLGYDIAIVAAVGTAKEVDDYLTKKGTPDINDLLYTIYGALPLFILKILF